MTILTTTEAKREERIIEAERVEMATFISILIDKK